MPIDRRSFLARALAFLAGAFSFSRPGRAQDAAGGAPAIPAALDPTLAAACERILPPAEGRPGAIASGAADHVRRALEHRCLRGHLRRVSRGLARLDEVARRDFGAAFPACRGEDQDRVLEFVQSGRTDADEFDGGVFLDDLVELCLEGFLGDPSHGGNRERAGWKWIGYAPGGPLPGPCGAGHDEEPR